MLSAKVKAVPLNCQNIKKTAQLFLFPEVQMHGNQFVYFHFLLKQYLR